MVLGLLLCEVGDLDDLLFATGKTRLERVLTDAFRATGATKHCDPSFIWSRDETMAAFIAEVQVCPLDSGPGLAPGVGKEAEMSGYLGQILRTF